MLFGHDYFTPFQCFRVNFSEQALVCLPTPLLMDTVFQILTNEASVNAGAHVSGPQCGKLSNDDEQLPIVKSHPKDAVLTSIPVPGGGGAPAAQILASLC